MEPVTNFNAKFREFWVSPEGQKYFYNQIVGFIGNDLKYVQIKGSTNFPLNKPKDITEPNYKKAEDIRNKFNRESEKGMENCIQTAEGNWAW